jgi:hypothetical protein
MPPAHHAAELHTPSVAVVVVVVVPVVEAVAS